MEPELSFRTDLFRGTAPYYDRYRRPYPNALLDDLCRRLPVTGSGRLVDLACGTGQFAFALAGRFRQVWAVDQEPELVAFGRAKAELLQHWAAEVGANDRMPAGREQVLDRHPSEQVLVEAGFDYAGASDFASRRPGRSKS